jgi:hypothetical protein
MAAKTPLKLALDLEGQWRTDHWHCPDMIDAGRRPRASETAARELTEAVSAAERHSLALEPEALESGRFNIRRSFARYVIGWSCHKAVHELARFDAIHARGREGQP